MTEQQTIALAVLVIAGVIVVAGLILWRRRETKRLNARFGTEYARVVQESGGRRQGEAGLVAREKRLNAIEIRDLSPSDREHYAAAWRSAQGEFVDDPKFSVTHADHLLNELMSKRGYPTGEFEQRSADLSVDHPKIVQNYRAAHDIAVRHGRGQASTEDLRQAMILYRSLFEELIDEPAAPAPTAPGLTDAPAT
jgi:hypothetical protein